MYLHYLWRFSEMKKALFMILALVLLLALVPVIALAADPVEGDKVTKSKAGFHCNDAVGNGKVGNYSGTITAEYQGDGEWVLVSPEYACPKCGSKDWIAYSNQSGNLTGNNPQFQHPNESPLDLDHDEPFILDPEDEEDPDEEAPAGVDPIGF
jgi:hypothetical protein